MSEIKIIEHLECCICQSTFKDPVITQCGHTYCKLCLLRWMYKNNTCPLCKTEIPKNYSFIRNIIINNILQSLNIDKNDQVNNISNECVICINLYKLLYYM